MLNRGMGLADAYGMRKFGQHFKVVGDLNYSPVSNKIGIEGDIDVVLHESSFALCCPFRDRWQGRVYDVVIRDFHQDDREP